MATSSPVPQAASSVSWPAIGPANFSAAHIDSYCWDVFTQSEAKPASEAASATSA